MKRELNDADDGKVISYHENGLRFSAQVFQPAMFC
jgi:hypothetical protein